jgi:hypothetical protein
MEYPCGHQLRRCCTVRMLLRHGLLACPRCAGDPDSVVDLDRACVTVVE